MNKFLGAVACLLVGFGLGFLLFRGAIGPATQSTDPAGTQKLGDSLVSVLPTHFTGGLFAGSSDQMSVSSAGVITSGGSVNTGNSTVTGTVTAAGFNSGTVGSSSSSPAALGSAASGHFVIAAAATTAGASTTVVTANSDIQLQIELTTPIAGTTCNTAATTTPSVATKVAGNGFTVSTLTAPVTNPLCLSYSVSN